jgi:hypothetical protein
LSATQRDIDAGKNRVEGGHDFLADPDISLTFDADPDPDPNVHFDADPDPVPQHMDENLRQLVSTPPRLHFEPPRLHFERPRPSMGLF